MTQALLLERDSEGRYPLQIYKEESECLYQAVLDFLGYETEDELREGIFEESYDLLEKYRKQEAPVIYYGRDREEEEHAEMTAQAVSSYTPFLCKCFFSERESCE